MESGVACWCVDASGKTRFAFESRDSDSLRPPKPKLDHQHLFELLLSSFYRIFLPFSTASLTSARSGLYRIRSLTQAAAFGLVRCVRAISHESCRDAACVKITMHD